MPCSPMDFSSNSYLEALRANGRFPPTGAEDAGGDGEKEAEDTLAWTLFLQSQLYERTGFLQEACNTLEVPS